MNGSKFGDLDWPLNVLHGLSAIAEFLECVCHGIHVIIFAWHPITEQGIPGAGTMRTCTTVWLVMGLWLVC